VVRVLSQAVPLLASWPLLYLTVSNPHFLTRLKNLQFADGPMQQVIVPTSFKHTQKLMVRTALAMVVVFLVSIVLLALYWPLSREAVLKELEDESQSRVNIGAFRGTYFCGEPLSFGLDLSDRDDRKSHKQNTGASRLPGDAGD